MRMTIDAGALRDALGQSFTGKQLEILEHALFEVDENDQLILTSQDLYKQSVVKLTVSDAEAGESTAMPNAMRAVLQGIEGDIHVEGEKAGSLQLSQPNGKGTRKYQFMSLDPDMFPKFDAGKRKAWKIDIDALRDGVGQVHYAMSKRDVRTHLLGVFIGRGRIIATNGKQIGTIPFDTGGEEFIIPREAIKPLLSFLQTDEDCHAFVYSAGGGVRMIGFSAGAREITLKLLDGGFRYPDITNYIAISDSDTDVGIIGRAEALALCSRFLAIEEPRYGAILMTFTPSGESVQVAGESGSVDFIGREGGDDTFEFTLDAYLLRETLSNILTDKVKIRHLSGPNTPICLLPEEGQAQHILTRWEK